MSNPRHPASRRTAEAKQHERGVVVTQTSEKVRRKRDDHLCCPWEAYSADSDDNAFHGCREAKRQAAHKCRYASERSVVVSRRLSQREQPPPSPRAPRDQAVTAGECGPAQQAPRRAALSPSPPSVIQHQDHHIRLQRWKKRPEKQQHHIQANLRMTRASMVMQTSTPSLLHQTQGAMWRPQLALPLIHWAPVASSPPELERPVPWRCQQLPVSSHEETGKQSSGVAQSDDRRRARGVMDGLETCQWIAAKLPRVQVVSSGQSTHAVPSPFSGSGWEGAQARMPPGPHPSQTPQLPSSEVHWLHADVSRLYRTAPSVHNTQQQQQQQHTHKAKAVPQRPQRLQGRENCSLVLQTMSQELGRI